MDAFTKLALLASLEEEFCELNHGPGTAGLNIPAVDYVVQPFGYTVNEIEEVSPREMVVPVCTGCQQALLGEKWTLFYCFECCSSQWINRRFAKKRYRHNILWLRGCPQCTSEFGGLYFTDFKALVDSPLLLKIMPDSAVA